MELMFLYGRCFQELLEVAHSCEKLGTQILYNQAMVSTLAKKIPPVILLLLLIVAIHSGSIPGCNDYNQNQTICNACSDGYQLSTIGTCVNQGIVPNCALYNSSDECMLCDLTYVLQPNKRCEKDYSGCLTYDTTNTNKCLVCEYGTVLLADGTCGGILKCKAFDAGVCLACETGFQLNTQRTQCIDNTGNCLKTSSSYGVCTQCKSGFFLSGFDCISTSQVTGCNFYNSNGQCTNCKKGYQLIQSLCQLNSGGIIKISPFNPPPASLDSLCLKYHPLIQYCLLCVTPFPVVNGVCQRCNVRQYLFQNSTCQPITIPKCLTADISGRCTSCQEGFLVSRGTCIPNVPLANCDQKFSNGSCFRCAAGYIPNNFGRCAPRSTPAPFITPVSLDPNCLTYSGTVCTKCSRRFYFSSISKFCVLVNPSCNTFNASTGDCLSCYPGFTLVNGKCPTASQLDPNCQNATQNGTCSLCFSGFYYSAIFKKCVPSNPVCKETNTNGSCTSCYPSFSLVNGTCIPNVTLSNCNATNSTGNCISCNYYFYLDGGECKIVSPLCRTYDAFTGFCTSCFNGSKLLPTGECTAQNVIPYCNNTNSTGDCIQCDYYYYLNSSGYCVEVSPQCYTYDNTTGNCLTCYVGYSLVLGRCEVSNGFANFDSNCMIMTNYSNGVTNCTACYFGYYLYNGKCSRANSLCLTLNQTNGRCTSCYLGYTLTANGNCQITKHPVITDPFCMTAVNGTCVTCYEFYYIGPNKTCIPRNVLCAQYTPDSSKCTDCYPGYTLRNGSCIYTPNPTPTIADPHCISVKNGTCVTCQFGYFLDSSKNNTCSLANPLCKTINSTGGCTSCYTGLFINTTTGNCTGNLPHCLINSDYACLKCVNRYYPLNGVCKPVSLLCAVYNQTTGACITCNIGYIYQDGICFLPAMGVDRHCALYEDTYCTQCIGGYSLQAFVCVADIPDLDPNCIKFNPTITACLLCYNDLQPDNMNCI